uniref:Uncharacterized protein n=1 Tax=Oryza rufipogon TaxID=4529 RepID=A0A0E0Q6N5_ORYRU
MAKQRPGRHAEGR